VKKCSSCLGGFEKDGQTACMMGAGFFPERCPYGKKLLVRADLVKASRMNDAPDELKAKAKELCA